MSKKLALIVVLFFAMGVILGSCAFLQKPTESNFKDPVIKLVSFQVPQYDGYWYISSKVKPTKGDAGNRGAPLPLSFVFEINNPNPYPVLLEGVSFTVAFDNDFQVVTVHNDDTSWIPPNKTNQARMNTMITTRSALLSILVTGGYKLKARGWSPWKALERWWRGVPVFSVPVKVTEGAFTFSADGVTRVLPFEAEVK